ncbi:hypothetical protein [Marinobacter sp. F4216]|uniref:hypothetical protein n=1 Tax=Marinobacter sp. F4216 TaxID=2874281 RepID=UPI001CC10A72|nr:hypothetical protein [Marinobacter sp. F4216]MBZ2168450.1 hypothetical protein [Marinobacter sp. F4216]
MRSLSGPALLSAFLFLGGCTSDAIDAAKKDTNDFGGASSGGEGFTPGTPGGGGTTSGLGPNEIRLTMEVPETAAPDAESSRRNLRLVKPESISVYATTDNSVSVPAEITYNDDLSATIAFPGGLPLGPDTLIEARFGDEVYRSMAADADQNVQVNPFSEFLVRQTIAKYSAFDIQAITDCTEQDDCTGKAAWASLADQIHDFEIDIPGTASKETALSLLGARGDFTSYIDDMMQYALSLDTSSGELAVLEGNYNSVFFGVELGQTFLESNLSNAGFWGVRTGQEQVLSPREDHVYPGLSFASVSDLLPGLNSTVLSGDIPYSRELLTHQAGNTFCLRDNSIWELNSHTPAVGSASIVNDIRLTAGRALFQTVTNNFSSSIGWTRNPYYMDAFISEPPADSNTPDRIVSSYFTAGKAIALELEGESYKRRDILENHFLSVIDINVERQSGFELSSVNGAYNIVYTSQRQGSSSSCQTFDNQPVMEVETGTGIWTVNSGNGSINESVATSVLARLPSGSVQWENTTSVTRNRLVSRRPSYRNNAVLYDGRLNFGISQLPTDEMAKPQLGVGASTPDGSFMAVNMNDSPGGDGLLIASSQHAIPAPTNGRYRLQGVSLGMSEDTNVLQHMNHATLTINSASSATLDPRILEVTHSVSGSTVSAPSLVDSLGDSVTLVYADAGNGQASFSCTDTTGELTLEGFFTPDQNQFYLRLRDTRNGEENIGLVLATRIR